MFEHESSINYFIFRKISFKLHAVCTFLMARKTVLSSANVLKGVWSAGGKQSKCILANVRIVTNRAENNYFVVKLDASEVSHCPNGEYFK